MNRALLVSHVVLTVLMIGCGQKQSAEDEEGGNVQATVAVKTIPLRRGDISTIVTAVGKVDALRKEKLLSPVAGKVASLKVLEGDEVKPGDVVAVIQTKESQAAVAGAEALLRTAKTSEQKAEAQRALDLARSTESSVSIRSTFGGTVATRAVSEGEFVAENAEMLTIVDPTTLVFMADVPSRELSSVAVGQYAAINLQAVPGRRIRAKVEALNPEADMLSQTLKVRLRFEELSEAVRRMLRTDLVGTAEIVVGNRRNVFIVPKAAVLRNDETNAYSIVTFSSDSLAYALSVEVMGMTDSTVAIGNHDLKDGMSIITEGNYALADSTRITVVE